MSAINDHRRSSFRANMPRLRRSLAERFWAMVQKTETCWLWTGTNVRGGYGQINDDWPNGRVRLRATAVSLKLAGVDVPTGMFVCHRCDNPRCVRPDHLFVGTVKDNSHDARRKGRLCQGERHQHAKLTKEKVVEARLRYRAGGVIVQELAEQNGVRQCTMHEAITGKTWAHVKEGL